MDGASQGMLKPDGTLAVRVSAALSDGQLADADAIEICKSILAPPLETRVLFLHRQLGEGIKQIAGSGGPSVEELSKNDAFVSAMFKALQVATTTHETEKLDALRNAVLNSAIDDSIDSATQMLFLRFVDEFTVWHVRVLKAMQNTEVAAIERGTTPRSVQFAQELGHIIQGMFPELDARKDLRRVIQSDLSIRGLIGTSLASDHLTPTGTNKFTSPLGDKFLAFIATPKLQSAL
jgi:hypothetical protein